MSKPKRLDWATNATHAAGGDLWSSQPNKVEPTAGKIATGRIPEERPPAEETNWWRNAAAAWLRWASGVQPRNWHPADWSYIHTGLPPGVWPLLTTSIMLPGAVCYDAGNRAFSAINLDGATIGTYDSGRWFNPAVTGYVPGGQGLAWASEYTYKLINDPGVVWALGAPATYVDIASDGAGTRIAVADDGTNSDLIARSVNYAAWAAQAPATAGRDWSAVDHDGSGLWAIGADNGQIDTSPTGATGTWTARASGLVTQIRPRCFRHSRDSANPYWIAMTATTRARSADGITWNAGAHGLPATPHELCYDALRQRWYVILGNGAVYYSANNGAGWGLLATLTAPAGAPRYWIACDGQGGLVAGCSEYTATTSYRLWASTDSGVTWAQVDLPGADGLDVAAGLAYGERFVAVGSASAWYTIRCDDA